ncbi:hypothetical protein ACKKBG_A01420 [Auxenochlorella protothecoides x Auxenochlorella symbiontica]
MVDIQMKPPPLKVAVASKKKPAETCIDSPPSGSDGGHLPAPPPTSGGAGQRPGADDIPDMGASAHGTSHHAPRPEEGPSEGRSPQRLHSLGSGSPPPGQYGVPLVAYQFGSFQSEAAVPPPWVHVPHPYYMETPGSSPHCYSTPMYGGSPPPGAPWVDAYGSSPPQHGHYLMAAPGYGGSPPYSPHGYSPPQGFSPPHPGYHYHPQYPGHQGSNQSVDAGAVALSALSLSRASSPTELPRSSSSSSLRRASARIARSNRAGGAYNASEYVFDASKASVPRGDRLWTTVMIRNIPNKYTQSFLLRHVNQGGCKGKFDFLYLPVDFRNACNLGYAFMNFLSVEAMVQLYQTYHGERWRAEESSTKVCEITYARVQGFEALVSHFKAAKFPVGDASALPLVFAKVENGVASCPLPINQYIDTSGGEEEAPSVEGTSECGESDVLGTSP